MTTPPKRAKPGKRCGAIKHWLYIIAPADEHVCARRSHRKGDHICSCGFTWPNKRKVGK